MCSGWLGHQCWTSHKTHENHPSEHRLPLCYSCASKIHHDLNLRMKALYMWHFSGTSENFPLVVFPSVSAFDRKPSLGDLRENTRCLGLQRATSSNCLQCFMTSGTNWPLYWRVWDWNPSCQREAILCLQISPLFVSEEHLLLPLKSLFLSLCYLCLTWLFYFERGGLQWQELWWWSQWLQIC